MTTRSSARRRRGTSDTARFILVLLLLAGAVYIALATSVGNYIAEKVIAPVFRLLSEKPNAQEPQTSPQPSASAQDSTDNAADTANTAANGAGLSLVPGDSAQAAQTQDTETPAQNAAGTTPKSEEVRIEGKTLYALQLGAFKEKANAEATAHELQKRGAGGYVQMDSAGLYRVLAAVYTDEESAKTVRKQIVDNDGLDAAVYAIAAPAAAFRVTAGAAQVEAVRDAFAVLESAGAELGKVCMEFDKKQIDVTSAKSRIAALKESAQKPYDQIAAAAGSSAGIVSDVAGTLKTLMDDLALFADKEAGSAVDFSAAMKYTHIKTVCNYAQLLNKITGN